MRIELNGIPMQVIHGGEQQIVQGWIDGQVVKATPLTQHRFVLIQVKHPRVQHLGVVQPTQIREVHVQLFQKHNQVTPVVEAMHVVVVVVRHKRLGQRVQRREVWVHHGPLPQRVVVPDKFP